MWERLLEQFHSTRAVATGEISESVTEDNLAYSSGVKQIHRSLVDVDLNMRSTNLNIPLYIIFGVMILVY